MIIITGQVEVKRMCLTMALDLCVEHVKRSRKESGCITHDVTQSLDNGCRLFFFEQWADDPSVKAHFELESSKKFVQDLTQLCEVPPLLSMYNADKIR